MAWGYMGKVPNRGDFITHNVPPEARDLLLEWCQASLAVSREQLGDNWLDAYLTSPIWHFAASPGAFMESGLIGTMIPSVDRVGRHFPFLVLTDYSGSALDAWRQPDWFSSMEDCVLAVLDDGWDEPSWYQRLPAIEKPEASGSRLKWPSGEGNMMLPGEAREDDWLHALLERRQALALWWTQGSAYVEPATLMTEGLPRVGQFAAMMVGQWESHGWQQGVMTE